MSVAGLKRRLSGENGRMGFLKLIVYYLVLFGIGFVFLYPILYMIVNSLLSPEDLVDPAVYWIPRKISLNNFVQAFQTLDFGRSFGYSCLMSVVPAVLQTLSTAVIGYGLARFRIPGQKLWLALIVTTFLIPSQITSVPRYILFNDFHMLNTAFPFYLPAVTGQGLQSAIFILVFFQFFSSYPRSFDEAAQLDGANRARIFLKVALPISTSAIVLSLLFSFVWYWNETSQANLLFGSTIKTLPLQLSSFQSRYEALFGSGSAGDAGDSVNRLNDSISLAGTLLSILPVVVMYLLLQKQFVESIERTGITGE